MAYGSADRLPRSDKQTPQLASVLAKLHRYFTATNVAELLEDGHLSEIGSSVEKEYEIDKRSRADWEESAQRAMDIALQVRQPKNYPFERASNIKYPLVTVAALQFGARAYPAIIDGNRIVKTQVNGSDQGVPALDQMGQPVADPQSGEPQWKIPPGAKRERADRVSQHMSWQLRDEMVEWEEDTDVLLHHLPIVGCAFRKVWRSEELRRNKAEMVPAIHLVVNNKVRSLDDAPRVTHEVYLYPQEIEERRRSGTYLDVELPSPSEAAEDEDAPQLFLEQHRYLDLDEDGYREPYIVTVHKESCTVVRVVANYAMEDIRHNEKRIIRIPKEQYFVKYSFIPDPKGGFYDIGFGKLLESLSETIDTTINQMLDAGHLQNAGGGFIGSGIRLKKREVRVTPGRYEQVETAGPLRDQIYNHEHPGPSPVLFQLLGMMIEASRDITAVKDILTGDTGDKVQTATTTLALIEQGLKVFTAIYKRVYRALKQEFWLLFRLNAKHLGDQEYFNYLDQEQAVAKSDYDTESLDVMPVADPKMVTDMQRSAFANVLMQIGGHPVLGQVQEPREALRRIYDAVGMPEPDKLIVPAPQGPTPQEQLMLEGAGAEVALKKAQVEKTAVETMKIGSEMEQMGKPADDGSVAIKAEEVRLKTETERLKVQADMELGQSRLLSDVALAERKLELERELRLLEMQSRSQERLEIAKDKESSKREAAKRDDKPSAEKAEKPDRSGEAIAAGMHAIAAAMTHMAKPKKITKGKDGSFTTESV